MNKNDRRYIKTEGIILKTFAELMYKKGFDKVTVKDITGASGISRGAFYIHYEDKYALLSRCENIILEELKRYSSNITSIKSNPAEEDFKKFFTRIISYYKEHYMLVSALLEENRHSKLGTWLKDQVAANSLKLYRNMTGKKEFPISIEYVASSIYYSHIGVINEWFHSGIKESPEEIAEIIVKLSSNSIFNL